MRKFSEANKIDVAIANATGSTLAIYSPNFEMEMYDRADFIITCPLLTVATATASGNECIVNAAVYTATAATSTALTALSSATASFGSTDGPVINGANMIMFTFNTASTGTTFALCSKQLTINSTHCTLTASATNYDVLGGTGLTNATYASALANIVNGTVASFSKYLMASTAGIAVGSSWNSTNTVFVWPKDAGSTVLSAVGKYGATANKGILVSGQFCAHIGVPTAKLPAGAKCIAISVVSSGLTTPINVNLIRSQSRYTPVQGSLAVNTDLGSTS